MDWGIVVAVLIAAPAVFAIVVGAWIIRVQPRIDDYVKRLASDVYEGKRRWSSVRPAGSDERDQP